MINDNGKYPNRCTHKTHLNGPTSFSISVGIFFFRRTRPAEARPSKYKFQDFFIGPPRPATINPEQIVNVRKRFENISFLFRPFPPFFLFPLSLPILFSLSLSPDPTFSLSQSPQSLYFYLSLSLSISLYSSAPHPFIHIFSDSDFHRRQESFSFRLVPSTRVVANTRGRHLDIRRATDVPASSQRSRDPFE